MLYKFCKWYISKCMRVNRLETLELVITSKGSCLRKGSCK